MPLAYDGSLVFVLNEFRESLLATVESTFVVGESVGMTMFSGKKTSPGRSADGIGDKTIVETNSLVSDAV